MPIIRLALFLFAFLGVAPSASTAPTPDATATANRVLGCYRNHNLTPNGLFACSGFWVTPRALTLCFLQAGCPVIADDVNGRNVAITTLGGEAKLDVPIAIDMKNVLTIPARGDIEACKAIPARFEQCVSEKMLAQPAGALAKCAAAPTDQARAECLTKSSSPEIAKLVTCAGTGKISPDVLAKCAPGVAPVLKQVQDAQACLKGKSGADQVGCLLPKMDPKQKALADCLMASSNSPSKASLCLGNLDPQVAQRITQLNCARKAANATAIAACVGGDAAKAAACASGDRTQIVACIASDRPEYKAAAMISACVQGGRTAKDLVANCSGLVIKDEKTRAALACAADAGWDTQKLSGCAAAAILPPEVAKLAACAATSTGPTSFGLCAAGPAMNEEWRIASECAVETGGNPVGFAGCTAGRLTMRELTKCLTGGSCFGPNNTIVKTYTNAFNDLIHGPGKNNTIVVALTSLQDLSGGAHSVVNDPGQIFGGKNSVFNNPGQVAGGPNSAVNVFLRTPLGGSNSGVNQFIQKPLGGHNSVPNQIIRCLGFHC